MQCKIPGCDQYATEHYENPYDSVMDFDLCRFHDNDLGDFLSGQKVLMDTDWLRLIYGELVAEVGTLQLIRLSYFSREHEDGHLCRMEQSYDKRYEYCRRCGHAERVEIAEAA